MPAARQRLIPDCRKCSGRLLAVLLLSAIARAADKPEPAKPPHPSPASAEHTEHLRGRVVWLNEALRRLHGVAADPDALESVAALETSDGKLFPIIRDARGRGFYKDPRLFEFDTELVARRYPGTDAVQVIRVYVWRDGKRFEFDYWCDICAIPMYELKECECCQGPIRFRFRPASPEEK